MPIFYIYFLSTLLTNDKIYEIVFHKRLKMNPIKKLLKAGIPRKKIPEQTGLSEPEISMLLKGKRKASLKQRKAFFDAFGISPWEWDKK